MAKTIVDSFDKYLISTSLEGEIVGLKSLLNSNDFNSDRDFLVIPGGYIDRHNTDFRQIATKLDKLIRFTGYLGENTVYLRTTMDQYLKSGLDEYRFVGEGFTKQLLNEYDKHFNLKELKSFFNKTDTSALLHDVFYDIKMFFTSSGVPYYSNVENCLDSTAMGGIQATNHIKEAIAAGNANMYYPLQGADLAYIVGKSTHDFDMFMPFRVGNLWVTNTQLCRPKDNKAMGIIDVVKNIYIPEFGKDVDLGMMYKDNWLNKGKTPFKIPTPVSCSVPMKRPFVTVPKAEKRKDLKMFVE